MKGIGGFPLPARIGAMILGAILVLALLAPILSAYQPLQTDLAGALRGPRPGTFSDRTASAATSSRRWPSGRGLRC
jgi:hypothetical protein